MEKKVKVRKESEEFMRDPRGRLVPIEIVDEIDKLRDDLVNELVDHAYIVRDNMRDLKRKAFDDIKAFVNLSAEKYGKSWGGSKGNITLQSYDGSRKIIVAIADNIDFNERLQIAKSLIDECLDDWGAESRREMRAIIDKAFYVDKGQRLNTKAILGLRTLNISHPKWKMAMDAISDAIIITSTKAYIRFYDIDSEGRERQVVLDMANA
jgi:hypothetical protein